MLGISLDSGFGMGVGGGGVSIPVIAFQQASMFAPLQNNLTLTVGTGSPTLTRATTATQQDGDGKYNQVLAGEARFQGMRREQNLLVSSEDNTGVVAAGGILNTFGATVTPTTISLNSANAAYWQSGVNYMLPAGSAVVSRVEVTSNIDVIVCYYIGGNSRLGPAINTQLFAGIPKIISAILPAGTAQSKLYFGFDNRTAAGATNTAPYTITASKWLIVDVSGRSNQNPPEYVPSTWNDTGVAGVRYFPYANGNTVTNNVVTQAQGAALPNAGKGNYLSEEATTNQMLWSRDFTNATWTKLNVTPALDQVGIDGRANSASSLTATLANGSVLQTITEAATLSALSFFIKRITGTGTITIQQGASTLDVTALINSSTYTQIELDATVLNPVIGIVIATSGDKIVVDMGQFENNPFATSPIPTTTVAVTRNADVLSYPSTGNLLTLSPYTMYCECSLMGVGDNAGLWQVALGSTSQYQPMLRLSTAAADGVATFWSNTGTNNASIAKTDAQKKVTGKYVGRMDGTNISIFSAGLKGTDAVKGTQAAEITTIQIGCQLSINQLGGTIGNVRIWQIALPDTTLQVITT